MNTFQEYTFKKGTTSQRIPVYIGASNVTTGAGRTGLAFGTAGLTCYYWREDAGNDAGTVVTLQTMTRGTWAAGGFIEKSSANMPGFYELGLPDAALATGADWVVVCLKGASTMSPANVYIHLVDYDPGDGVRLGLTALPNAAAEAAGGLITNGTGAGQFNVDGGRGDADVEYWKGTTAPNAATVADVWTNPTRTLTAPTNLTTTDAAIGLGADGNVLTSSTAEIGIKANGLAAASIAANAITSAKIDGTATDAIAAKILVTPANLLETDAGGHVSVQMPRLRKNTAYANFTFGLISSADHFSPIAGMTVTAQRSIDGAALGACANAVTEIGNGLYKIDLAASDLNGDNVAFRFTATGADTRLVSIVTQA